MVEKNEVTTSAEAVDKPWIVQEDELDMPVWRYMDFAKYIDILENSCLYFSPINGFEDKLEGFNNVLNEGLTYKLDTSGDVPKIVSTQEVLTHPVEIDNAKKFKTFFKETEEKYKASIGVSCWRMDTSESHAMWKVYVKSNEGIAIKSSIRLVKESVQLELLQNLEAIKVQYIDYNHQVLDMVKSLAIGIYHKSNNYNDDKKIRFIYNEIITRECKMNCVN